MSDDTISQPGSSVAGSQCRWVLVWLRVRRRFADLRISTKIVSASVVGSTIFAALGVFGQLSLRDVTALQEREYATNVRALDHMTSARSAVGGQLEAVLSFILADAGGYGSNYQGVIAETDQTIDHDLAQLARISLPDEEQASLREVVSNVGVWRTGRDTALDASRAGEEPQGVLYTISRLDTISASVKRSADDLLGQLVDEVAVGARQAADDSAATARLLLLLGVLGAGAAMVLSVLTARSISRPLAEVVDVLNRAARGDLSKQVRFARKDEIGRMGDSLNETLGILQHAFEEVRHEATHDYLTGLANRALLRDRLTVAEEQAGAGVLSALVLLDLDGFKQINDSWGHAAGDHVLTVVAERLSRAAREGDTVARLGGDEFAIVLHDIGSESEARRVVDRLCRAMQQPTDFHGRMLTPQASVGMALLRGDACVEAGMREADEELYAAKAEAKGIHVEPRHGRAAQLAAALPAALAEGQFEVLYQPLVGLSDRRPVAVEALLRWHHPEFGTVSPVEFIPIAERTGSISAIGLWVLEQACRQVRRLQLDLPAGTDLYASVNLSPHQLLEPTLVDDVLEVLRRTGLAPGDLVLEVTESAVLDEGVAVPALAALREQGVRIAIDDFGTGYSSLHYLARLPVDILKIDRSLTSDLDGTPERSVIIAAVVHLSRVLQFTTVVEGVETVEQADEVELLGCHVGQGYLWAEPMSADAAHAAIVAASTYGMQFSRGWCLDTNVGGVGQADLAAG
jgi:diguanylate cyclase (GGDEF)-like protein